MVWRRDCVGEGILEVDEVAGDRVVELRRGRSSSRVTKVPVAQVVDCHGVTVGHEEREEEEEQQEVESDEEKTLKERCACHGWDDYERQVRTAWAMWCDEWLDNATTDSVQVCSSLHFVRVYVRRVIHVIVHNGLTVVEGVLVVVHTFT